MVAVLVAVTMACMYVGSAVIARHRAQSAADLAALAAAGRLSQGATAACSYASAVAHAVQANITRCVVEELDVVVAVEVRVDLGRFGFGPARATARAGPTDTGG
jgi:secretion/DNA translocation related TadE-like protein